MSVRQSLRYYADQKEMAEEHTLKLYAAALAVSIGAAETARVFTTAHKWRVLQCNGEVIR